MPPKARRRAESLIAQANVTAEWASPPTADDIARLDRERMARDDAFRGELTDEENEIATLLLAEHGPEKCAAALARLLRARLPQAEEVADPGVGPDFSAPAKGPRAAKAPLPGAVWFRLDIGRNKNADPKWMLPMLCRNGGVTRADIGAIRIFPQDSKVEIAGEVAEAFLKNMRRPGGESLRVERIGPGGEGGPPPRLSLASSRTRSLQGQVASITPQLRRPRQASRRRAEETGPRRCRPDPSDPRDFDLHAFSRPEAAILDLIPAGLTSSTRS